MRSRSSRSETPVQPNRIPTVDDRIEEVFGAEPEGEGHQRRRWRRLVRVVSPLVVTGLVVLVLSTRPTAASAHRFRTAKAEVGAVNSEISTVGTVEAISSAAVAFPTAGTVEQVLVGVGDTVGAGDSLASIDPTTLQRTLHEKQNTLAEAKLKLAEDLNSTEAADEAEQTSEDRTAAVNGGSAGDTAGSDTAGSDTAAAKQAVVDAQKSLDQALATAVAAATAATTACGASIADPSTQLTGSDGALSAKTKASEASRDASGSETCSTSQRAVSVAQTQVQSAVSQLETSSGNYSALLEAQLVATSRTAASAAPSTSSAPEMSASVSAADLVAAQKAVDSAQLDVTVAIQALAQTSISTPIDGTVVDVSMSVGDQVDAGSSTATITVRGSGGSSVVALLPLAQMSKVKTGQEIRFSPDGSTGPDLAGRIVAVALVPDDTATTTSYRVTMTLDDPEASLGNGATGTLRIVTGEVRSALSIPTSALRVDGTSKKVSVPTESGSKQVKVEVGVAGATRTEILDGIEAGQRVIVADLDKALPGSATETKSDAGPDDRQTSGGQMQVRPPTQPQGGFGGPPGS